MGFFFFYFEARWSKGDTFAFVGGLDFRDMDIDLVLAWFMELVVLCLNPSCKPT